MDLIDLDARTRGYMLREFAREQRSGRPYVPLGLSAAGRAAFSGLVRVAIMAGSGDGLAAALEISGLWNHDAVHEIGVEAGRPMEVSHLATLIGLNEFNTWYVRGLAAGLRDDGAEHCEVYRAAAAEGSCTDCAEYEGRQVSVRDVYAGHRARYWPPPGNPEAFSIPDGPGCFHSIRRGSPASS